jgi:alpha-ribazole phosphatase
MARRLLLLRHAAIESGHAHRLIGATDVGLAPMAPGHADALAARIKGYGPQHCFLSPKLRCRLTAEALGLSLPTEVDDNLREIDFGRWENRTIDEIGASDGELLSRWADFDRDFAFPEGESIGGFWDRVCGVARRICEHEADTVLAVTHGGVIRSIICLLLGLEPRHYVLFNVEYASLAVLDLFENHGVLTALGTAWPEGNADG